MEEVGSGAIPISMRAILPLARVSLVGEEVVRVLGEVVVPSEFVEPSSGGLGAAEGDGGEGPEHVEEVACMALFAVRSMASDCGLGVVAGGFFVA